MARLVIGTRGSALARWQSALAADTLRRHHPNLQVDERIVRTEGDESQEESVPLAASGGTGVFVRRLEQALVDRDVDVAVHSLKDMPTDQPDGLTIHAVLERHDPRDALVSREGWTPEEVPAGALIGTGSPRRRCQLLHHRPDIRVEAVRGNVDTRVRKVLNGEVDALVLAVAGLERLGIDSVPFRPIDPRSCIPAVGQGAIAIELRRDDERTADLVAPLNHGPTFVRAGAERAFLRRLGGGCLAPATAHARIVGDRVHVEAVVGDPDGRVLLYERETGLVGEAEAIGRRLAERLLSEGGAKILEDARLAGSEEHGRA